MLSSFFIGQRRIRMSFSTRENNIAMVIDDEEDCCCCNFTPGDNTATAFMNEGSDVHLRHDGHVEEEEYMPSVRIVNHFPFYTCGLNIRPHARILWHTRIDHGQEVVGLTLRVCGDAGLENSCLLNLKP